MLVLSCAWASEAITARDAITAARILIVFSIITLRAHLGHVGCWRRAGGWAQKESGNRGGAQRGHGACQEYGAEACHAGQQPEGGNAEPESDVEKGSVSTHRESTVLWRHPADRFDAKTRIDQ